MEGQDFTTGLLTGSSGGEIVSIPGDLHLSALNVDLKLPLIQSYVLYIYTFLEKLSTSVSSRVGHQEKALPDAIAF